MYSAPTKMYGVQIEIGQSNLHLDLCFKIHIDKKSRTLTTICLCTRWLENECFSDSKTKEISWSM